MTKSKSRLFQKKGPGEGPVLKDNLVMKGSDLPKLRTSVMTTVIQCEEAKALAREKFIRPIHSKCQAWLKEKGEERVKERFGPHSVTRIPDHLLKSEITKEDIKAYILILRELAKIQMEAIRLIDPWEPSEALKGEAAEGLDSVLPRDFASALRNIGNGTDEKEVSNVTAPKPKGRSIITKGPDSVPDIGEIVIGEDEDEASE